MKKKNILIALVFLGLFTSCDKNQKVINKLDGSWNSTSFEKTSGANNLNLLDGYNFAEGEAGLWSSEVADVNNVRFDFTACKLKSGNSCAYNVVAINSMNQETLNSNAFTVIDEGEDIRTIVAFSGGLDTIDFKIINLKKGEIELNWEYETQTYTMKMEKQ
ncbi:MAG: hypothetical protein AB8B72_01470 [Crocinitomicaceae bacterium]